MSSAPRHWRIGERTPRPPRFGLIRSHPAATLSVEPAALTAESIRVQRTIDSTGAMPVMLPAILQGYFSVTTPDSWSEIRSEEGHFMERVERGAYARSMAEDNIACLFRHGRDPMFSDRPLGVVRDLAEDDFGARYVVDLYSTPSMRELLPGLATGAFGSSYGFNVRDEVYDPNPGRSSWNPAGLPTRVIKDAKVREIGPCTFPAQKRTSAGLAQHGNAPMLEAASSRPRPHRPAAMPASWRLPVSKPTPAAWKI